MAVELKKSTIIISGAILIFLATFVIAPQLLCNKIKKELIEISNKHLKAKLEIRNVDVSLLNKFPNLCFTLDNTIVLGVDSFESDTLIFIKKISFSLNLKNIINKKLQIKDIWIDSANIKFRTNKEGLPNWDIKKTTDETKQFLDVNTLRDAFQRIEITNSNIEYLDMVSQTYITLRNIEGNTIKDKNQENIYITASTDELICTKNHIPLLSRIQLKTNTTIQTRWDKMSFTLTNSKLEINDLQAYLRGFVTKLEEDKYDFCLNVDAPNTTFAQALSILPAFNNEHLQTVQSNGNIDLRGSLVGLYSKTDSPLLDFRLSIKDARLKYPNLPKAIHDINLKMSLIGKIKDNQIETDIQSFRFNIDNEYFLSSFQIKPSGIMGEMKAKIDLSTLKKVFPISSVSDLNGTIISDFDFNKERNKKLISNGFFSISKLKYKKLNQASIFIDSLALKLNPNRVSLEKLDINYGKSSANIIGYIFDMNTLDANMQIESKKIDILDLLINYKPSLYSKLINNKLLSQGLTKILKTDKLESLIFQDIHLPLVLENDKLIAKSSDFRINDGIKLSVEGYLKLDQTIDYHGTISLPNNKTNSSPIIIPWSIKGKLSDPKINIKTSNLTMTAWSNIW